MTREKIKEMIVLYFKTPYREISTGWVMTNCPFAEYTHLDGDDKRFSFGISVKNGYHCFTCGEKGHLLELPKALARYSHFFNYSLQSFIEDWYEEEDYFSDAVEVDIFTYNFDFIKKLPFAKDLFHLSVEDCRKWNIRYDQVRRLVYFPYYDYEKKNIISLKARAIDKKLFFYIASGIKTFYGGWRKPVKYLFIVEGERDTIFVSKYHTAWGTSGYPTRQMIDKLRDLRKKVILFLDNDETGRNIKRKLIYSLSGIVKLYEVRNYAGCKDPAEMYEKGLLEEAFKSIKKI